MNATATRIANRQIRRAFGEEALNTINEQGETLTNIVLPRLMTLGKTAGEVDTRLGALEQARSTQHNQVQQLEQHVLHWLTMTRWQRLKWVLGW